MFTSLRSHWRSLPLLATTLLTVLSLACGGDSSSPAPTDPSEPGPGPGSSVATLAVTNHSIGTAMFLRRRACGTSQFGSDMLGSEVLFNGETMSFEIEPGCYDFRFTAAEAGLATFLIESVQLEAGQTKTLEITEWPAE